MDVIHKYFSKLTPTQIRQLEQLADLYSDWNSKINVISRKDIDNIYLRHVLHSLAVSKAVTFRRGAEILDLGTGGGFPGIPLAILFPEVHFTLIDGTGKKIKVVNAVAESIGLTNVSAKHIRAEELKQRFDFVVTRAVAGLDKLQNWSNRLIKRKGQHAIPNGIFALKGGNVKSEQKLLSRGSYSEIYPLNEYFEEEFYQEKYLIYVQG